MELSFSKGVEAVTEARLGLPGEFFNPALGAFLSLGELGADFGRDAVVGGLFDEDPSCVGVAAFTDSTAALFFAAGAFSGDKAEEGHELFGMFEAAEGSDLRNGHHGGDELEAFEGHEGFDEGLSLPVVEELEHCFFKSEDALVVKVDGGEVVLKDAVVGGIGQGEVAEVALVGFGPVGLSIVVVTETTKHGEESGFGAAKVVNCIGAGPAEVADGLVNTVGDVDGDEVVGAEVFCELHGIAIASLCSPFGQPLAGCLPAVGCLS